MLKYGIVAISLVVLSCATSYCYADNDWIAYQYRPVPPVVYVPTYPTVTYSTQETFIVRPVIITHGWVPYYTTKTVVTESRGIFCKYSTVVQQPTIEWVYQPIYR